MRIVFMGTPEFAAPSLMRLVGSEHDVVAVYTRPDKPSGRGRGVSESPVKQIAGELGIEIRQVESFRSADDVDGLARIKPDAVIVASFGVILPQAVLDIPPYSCLNIHPSLLPRHRGPTPVPAAILAGDDVTGTSIMLIERKIDSGPVLAQREVPIDPSDTTGSLMEKLARVSADLLMDTLTGWFDGTVTPRTQRDEDATHSKTLGKNDGEIDWKLTAVELWRRVRAYYPWPSSYTYWNGKVLRIIEARQQGGRVGDTGRVLDLGPGEVGVQTGEGILKLVKVQVEGRREMSISEFVRGQRGLIGSVLPS